MNHIIPTTTKNQKLVAKHIQACAKKLLNHDAIEHRPYVKYCYLKDNFLYMTDAKAMIKFYLEFDAPGSGFFQIATIGKELWLIDQALDFAYLDPMDLFEAEIELCTFERDTGFISKYCRIIHSMSTPENIGCIDIEYFKLVPDNFKVYSSANPYTKQASEYPLVFHAPNFQAVVMPIKCK